MPHSSLNMLAGISGLPVPDTLALAHSDKLSEQIRKEIDQDGGHISFCRFMELALYAPGQGYYHAGTHKLGAGGDFVTAPEISPLFSYCLARQCEQILAQLGHGVIFELGAGSGVMACDIMQELQGRGSLPEEYLILEVSADLRQRQQQLVEQRLPELLPRFRWLDTLPEPAVEGVILANEILDALPIERIRLGQDTLSQLCVSRDGPAFVWQEMPADTELVLQFESHCHELHNTLPIGYTTEINTGLGPWLSALTTSLGRGVMLLIDYGYPGREYYHPQRVDGTLLCHYRQRAHQDPFLYVGLQDITASVNFSALAEATAVADLFVHGYCTQAHFLLACGLDTIMAEQTQGNDHAMLALSQQAKLLTLPSEMGEKFKVMALTRDMETPLIGFRLRDHRERL